LTSIRDSVLKCTAIHIPHPRAEQNRGIRRRRLREKAAAWLAPCSLGTPLPLAVLHPACCSVQAKYTLPRPTGPGSNKPLRLFFMSSAERLGFAKIVF
jgi:hypothetical protein